MDKETFLNKIKEIGVCEDDAQRRTMLAELNNEAAAIYDANAIFKTEKETWETERQKLENDNETLRKANMQMFLQVGTAKEAAQNQQTTVVTGQKPAENTTTKRSFENLFNEKGELK